MVGTSEPKEQNVGKWIHLYFILVDVIRKVRLKNVA